MVTALGAMVSAGFLSICGKEVWSENHVGAAVSVADSLALRIVCAQKL